MATKLIEYVASPNVKVDREAGVIRGVKLLGLTSKNGRRYTESAVRNAASLYEGARSHIDHRDPKAPAARSLSTRFGVIKGVSYRESEGLFGDLHYTKSHPMAEPVTEMAERFPESFGMSHDADGSVRRVGGETLVESIQAVNSVDVVDCPATTRGLHESEEPMKTTLKKLIEATEYAHTERLLEMLPEMMDPEAEMEAPPAEDGGDPIDAVATALSAKVSAAIADPAVDDAEVGKLAKAASQTVNMVRDKMEPKAEEEPAEEEPPADDSETMESLKASLGSLQETIANFAKRDEARGVLESVGTKPSEGLLAELVECDNREAMRKLAGGWSPEKLGREKPNSGPLQESVDIKYPEKSSDVIAMLKNR